MSFYFDDAMRPIWGHANGYSITPADMTSDPRLFMGALIGGAVASLMGAAMIAAGPWRRSAFPNRFLTWTTHALLLVGSATVLTFAAMIAFFVTALPDSIFGQPQLLTKVFGVVSIGFAASAAAAVLALPLALIDGRISWVSRLTLIAATAAYAFLGVQLYWWNQIGFNYIPN